MFWIMFILSTFLQTKGDKYEMKKDTVLLENGVLPNWILWKDSALPNADLVYVDPLNWDLWVIDENGGNKNCLTSYDDNILGINFPLDEDSIAPAIHWKGAPIVHPFLPIIFFRAENEHSAHKPLENAPSIGWDNDIWALDVSKKNYYRLTNLDSGQGLQRAAISEDGKWFVYPLRYDKGNSGDDYGFSKMIFCEIVPDTNDQLQLVKRFEREPNGQMYYEPNDIHKNDSLSYSLLYSASSGVCCDPYEYKWTWDGDSCYGTNKSLQTTPQHEEFFMFSPSGDKIAWMKGPYFLYRYFADLYISNPDFTEIERITWYNDSTVWPDSYKPNGCQLDCLTWNDDGTTIFFGLWIHDGPLKPFNSSELHRLDLFTQGINEESNGSGINLKLLTTCGERVEVRYTLPKDESIELSVYGVDGRKKDVIANGYKTTGMHTNFWKPFSSGVYFIRLKTSDNIITRKTIWVE
ncbi:MAG: T9SS type A sorting domain-containing protein [bacterium]